MRVSGEQHRGLAVARIEPGAVREVLRARGDFGAAEGGDPSGARLEVRAPAKIAEQHSQHVGRIATCRAWRRRAIACVWVEVVDLAARFVHRKDLVAKPETPWTARAGRAARRHLTDE